MGGNPLVILLYFRQQCLSGPPPKLSQTCKIWVEWELTSCIGHILVIWSQWHWFDTGLTSTLAVYKTNLIVSDYKYWDDNARRGMTWADYSVTQLSRVLTENLNNYCTMYTLKYCDLQIDICVITTTCADWKSQQLRAAIAMLCGAYCTYSNTVILGATIWCNDQQIHTWSKLIIAMNRWLIMHAWTMIIHICMISHLFITMININHVIMNVIMTPIKYCDLQIQISGWHILLWRILNILKYYDLQIQRSGCHFDFCVRSN